MTRNVPTRAAQRSTTPASARIVRTGMDPDDRVQISPSGRDASNACVKTSAVFGLHCIAASLEFDFDEDHMAGAFRHEVRYRELVVILTYGH